ncbi:Ribosomal RNA small subunit methyltransferase E [invertebrate metagenome]|uniref:16S rRNA (uracil(1498)-N(3))-methyltransferase n=1 Tax=invertebrate metagenome TaxID=1711999 RepID=A0A2H9T811_9ZZZZ
MRNPRIYSPQTLAEGAQVNLCDSAANHVIKVLRMQADHPVILFDGKGQAFQGNITSIHKKNVLVTLLSLIPDITDSPLRIELGQTLSRGERMDWAIQKATEMGVTEITPLFSERCEVKLPRERQEKRLQHWRQIAVSACEQCGRSTLPMIHSPLTVTQWLDERSTELNFVLHHRTEKKLTGYTKPASLSLLIGPEGGLTPGEINAAREKHFNSLALGPRVLRTETAPITAITLMQYLWGDL